ncbi:hypothetical protein ARMGADRAFT_1061793 [Armillaria gallica]|uniref:Uncharacterized protein n=1 Tax=Armillaria gallica TaxID=47427 RepID=A0A2H3DZ83_ARMGA|nr:hypothetical protein ARMGADRAFT_1061793 [Armillaria gallica]
MYGSYLAYVLELLDPLDLVHLAPLWKTFQRVLIPGSLQGQVLDDALGLFTVYLSPLRPSWFRPVLPLSLNNIIARESDSSYGRSTFGIADLERVLECVQTTGRVGRPHAETGLVRDYEEICQAFLVAVMSMNGAPSDKPLKMARLRESLSWGSSWLLQTQLDSGKGIKKVKGDCLHMGSNGRNASYRRPRQV